MIRLVTIEREYACGAAEVAKLVAERKGWKLWDQLLTDEIARLMDCESSAVQAREERRDPLYYRMFKSFLRGSFEGTLNAPRLKLVDAECIREMSERLVRQLADLGNAVIVGRGSAYYLGDRRDAFHVFLYAPFEHKVRRLESAGKPEKEAIELVESVDRERSAFIKQKFNIEWPSRPFFDVMVNTAMGIEASAEIILESAAAFEKHSIASMPKSAS
ncbi:MAG TPA: cytidylate kinase-like family protein [Bryobacteraceae bacterium]|nr:cytidylate kinase-like family protein [Bryobacteraceae bacterium]